MQKKLIALAVASLVSGGAFAQSSVTIFGVVDVAVQSGKYSDATGNLTRMASGGNTTNRLGFKGTEDLGNGMYANFLLEAQPVPDSGTHAVAAQFWNRSSTVGLSGKTWGSVNLGRQYTPWFNAAASADIYGTTGVGTPAVLWTGDTRMNNSIRYDSPSMNGFSAALMYGFGQQTDAAGVEGTTATTKNLGKEVGLKLSYANGPISLNYGYDKQQTAQAADVDTTRNALNGSYDFKVVKLGVGWNTNKTSDNLTNDRFWTVTALVPVFGKDYVKFAYARLNNKATADCDARLISIGYEHNMSKRTALYGTYGKMNNDTNQSKTLGGGVAVGIGYDPSAWEFGVKHAF